MDETTSEFVHNAALKGDLSHRNDYRLLKLISQYILIGSLAQLYGNEKERKRNETLKNELELITSSKVGKTVQYSITYSPDQEPLTIQVKEDDELVFDLPCTNLFQHNTKSGYKILAIYPSEITGIISATFNPFVETDRQIMIDSVHEIAWENRLSVANQCGYEYDWIVLDTSPRLTTSSIAKAERVRGIVEWSCYDTSLNLLEQDNHQQLPILPQHKEDVNPLRTMDVYRTLRTFVENFEKVDK